MFIANKQVFCDMALKALSQTTFEIKQNFRLVS